MKAAEKRPRTEGLEEAGRIPATTTSPSRALRREERLERLQSSLDRLPPEYRQVVRLARIEGLNVKEIAERMNRSVDSVKHLLARALVRLKSTFGQTESLHLPDRRLDFEEKGDGAH